MDTGEKPRGSVALSEVVASKPLFEADSCLEFLILALCNNLNLLPKQAAGLLVQDNRYLKKVMSKGLKGDFSPLRLWFQDIYSNTERLCDLLKEEQEDALLQVLATLQCGFSCLDEEVRTWACRLFSKFSFDFEERGLEEQLWTWFVSGPVRTAVDLCVSQTVQLEVAVDLLFHLSQGKLIQLFSLVLRDVFPTVGDYLNFIALVMDTLLNSETTQEELQDSGVVTYWIELCLREAENLLGECRLTALVVLHSLWVRCTSTKGEEDSTVLSILTVFKRGLQDHMEVVRTSCCVLLFDALEQFARDKSVQAPGIYRALVLKLVEEDSDSCTEQLVLASFVRLLAALSTIPISPLMNILAKKYSSEGNWTIADIDLFAQIARHEKLTLEQAIQLVDICGRIYLTDSVYVRAASVPISLLSTRYLHTEAMQEYLLKLCRVMVLSIVASDVGDREDLETMSRVSQRNMNANLIQWLVQLQNEDFNQKLGELIFAINAEYRAETQQDHNTLKLLLVEIPFTAPLALAESFSPEPPSVPANYQIMPIADVDTHPTHDTLETEPYSLLAIRDQDSVMPPSKPSHSSAFPHRRVQQALDRIKKTRSDREERQRAQLEKALKDKETRDKAIKQQLEMRKIEQGVTRGISDSEVAIYPYSTVKPTGEMEDSYRLLELDSEDLDAVKVLNRKYMRVFKALFQKFSGSGFAVKKETGSSFEWLAERKERLTEAELVKVLVLFKVVPSLATKEEVKVIMRTYCAQIAHQHDLNVLDFDGFVGILGQLAFHVYSPAALPPAIRFKQLLLRLRESSKEQGLSLDLFDDPDPGQGDRDVARRLNALLKENPDTELPEGFRLGIEQDVEVIYSVSSILNLPEAVRYSLEIVDEMLASAYGVHLLEPASRIVSQPCAKGLKRDDLPPLRPQKSPEIFPHHVLSPTLKFELAQFPSSARLIAHECAQVLESLLISVSLGMGRVIQRPATQARLKKPKRQEVTPEPVQARREDWKERAKEVQDRMARSIQEKVEKRKKEELDLAEKKRLEVEEQRKQALRATKDKEARSRLLKDWTEKKQAEKVKDVQTLTAEKAKQDKDKQAKQQSYRQLHTRLETLLKAKQEQWKQVRETVASEHAKALAAKSLHQLRASKLLSEEREKAVVRLAQMEQTRAFLDSEETQRVLRTADRQIGMMFDFFQRKAGGRLDGQQGLKLHEYARLAVQLDLVPTLISAEVNALIYKSLTKDKEQGLEEADFRKALLHIVEVAKDRLNEQAGQPGAALTTVTLTALLTHLHLTQSVAELALWLKGITEVRWASAERRKPPSRTAAPQRPSLTLPPTQEADIESDTAPVQPTDQADLEAINKEIAELEALEAAEARTAQEARSQAEALRLETTSVR